MHMMRLLLICMMLWRWLRLLLICMMLGRWLRLRHGLGHLHQLRGLRYSSGRERAQMQARYGWKVLIILMISIE
jgi:hypothetical protein